MKTKNNLNFNSNEDEILITKMLSKYYPYWPDLPVTKRPV
jgi:hypothetical protein